MAGYAAAAITAQVVKMVIKRVMGFSPFLVMNWR
jgi:hypothetical protein